MKPPDASASISALRKLLLIRHGLPDYRFRQRGDEVPGPPLSPLGLGQAQQAACVIAAFRPVALYSSPLARARQTAACLGRILSIPIRESAELKEWHRTETLYDVSVRSARWLRRWLAGTEPCAALVGHASPLLAIIRTALYLPHAGWYKPGRPDQLELNTCDRLEMSMASVFALTFTPQQVTAELLFHPAPRVADASRRRQRCFPRPVFADGENTLVRRPNFGRLIGYPSGDSEE